MAPSPSKDFKDAKKGAAKPAKVSVAKELSDLVHFKSVHFGTFEKAKEKKCAMGDLFFLRAEDKETGQE